MKKTASAFVLLGLLLLSACAASGNASDHDKSSGLYGGLSGGWTHP